MMLNNKNIPLHVGKEHWKTFIVDQIEMQC